MASPTGPSAFQVGAGCMAIGAIFVVRDERGQVLVHMIQLYVRAKEVKCPLLTSSHSVLPDPVFALGLLSQVFTLPAVTRHCLKVPSSVPMFASCPSHTAPIFPSPQAAFAPSYAFSGSPCKTGAASGPLPSKVSYSASARAVMLKPTLSAGGACRQLVSLCAHQHGRTSVNAQRAPIGRLTLSHPSLAPYICAKRRAMTQLHGITAPS